MILIPLGVCFVVIIVGLVLGLQYIQNRNLKQYAEWESGVIEAFLPKVIDQAIVEMKESAELSLNADLLIFWEARDTARLKESLNSQLFRLQSSGSSINELVLTDPSGAILAYSSDTPLDPNQLSSQLLSKGFDESLPQSGIDVNEGNELMLRAVVRVEHEGQLLGSLVTGGELYQYLDFRDKISNMFLATLIKNPGVTANLDLYDSEAYHVNAAFYIPPDQVDTFNDLAIEFYFQNLDYARDSLADKHYNITRLPLIDFSSTEIGALLLFQDITDITNEYRRALLFHGVTAGFCFLLLFGIFYRYTGQAQSRIIRTERTLLKEVEKKNKALQYSASAEHNFRNLFANAPIALLELETDLISPKGIEPLRVHLEEILRQPKPELTQSLEWQIDRLINKLSIRNANIAAARLFGYTQIAELKEEAFDLRTVISPSLKAAILLVAQGGDDLLNLECQLYLLSKGQRSVVAELSRIKNSGKSFSILISLLDFTDNKRRELDVVAAMEAAEEANRAKSVFMNNMSHELKTPLNAIIGFSDLLAEMKLSPEQAEYLELIQSSSKHLNSLIRDILEISNIESGQVEVTFNAFSVQEMINDVVHPFRARLASRGIELEINLHPDLPDVIFGDHARIAYCLDHLLNNADKFTEKGRITLSLVYKQLGPYDDRIIEKNYVQMNKALNDVIEQADAHRETVRIANLTFVVENTGIGIPEEDLTRIFEPFMQGDLSSTRKYGGNGLGLTISRKVAELLNGGVYCTRSNVGDSEFQLVVTVLEVHQKQNIIK